MHKEQTSSSCSLAADRAYNTPYFLQVCLHASFQSIATSSKFVVIDHGIEQFSACHDSHSSFVAQWG